MTARETRGAWPRPSAVRAGTLERILRAILEEQPQTALEVARALRIPLYRARELCEELARRGLIDEEALIVTTQGRLHLLAAYPELERTIVKQGELPLIRPR